MMKNLQVKQLRNIPVSRILYLILGFQFLISLATVLLDIEYRWVQYFYQKELREGPVEPGDQRRLFEPKKSKPKIFPERVIREVELPEQMPDRLMFEVIKLKGFGPTILVYGGIEDGDFARFKNYYNTLDEPPKNITFNSPGGSVYEALDLGRFIRSKDMKSVMLPGNYCFSACPYMFAAGRKRVAFQDSALGMHQHYYDESIILPTFLAVENIQIGQGQTMLYLIEMDISPGVMLYSLNTPPDEIYVLVKEELLETDLATEFVDR